MDTAELVVGDLTVVLGVVVVLEVLKAHQAPEVARSRRQLVEGSPPHEVRAAAPVGCELAQGVHRGHRSGRHSLHDVARGRGSLEKAIGRIKAPALVMGISSDILYPTYQQRQIADMLVAHGVPSQYVEIDSPHGHDAFLINFEQVGPPLKRFLAENY